MKRLDAMLLKVFLYGLPVVAMLAIFAYAYSTGMISQDDGYIETLNKFTGLFLAVWVMLAFYLSLRLIVSETFRDQVLARIAFLRENDEREAILTGKATRATFLTSLAILILLFCLSCFQLSVYRVPPEEAVNGKTGKVTFGFGFSLLERDKQNRSLETSRRENIFSYRGLPISSEAMLLLLIAWMIASYNYSIRRSIKT